MESAPPIRSFSPPPQPEPIDFDTLIPLATFRKGLPERVAACPRCEGPVAHEPGCIHCLVCGRLWPLAGALVEPQRLFELVSGLLGGSVLCHVPTLRW
jgi:hypothetical protein